MRNPKEWCKGCQRGEEYDSKGLCLVCQTRIGPVAPIEVPVVNAIEEPEKPKAVEEPQIFSTEEASLSNDLPKEGTRVVVGLPEPNLDVEPTITIVPSVPLSPITPSAKPNTPKVTKAKPKKTAKKVVKDKGSETT